MNVRTHDSSQMSLLWFFLYLPFIEKFKENKKSKNGKLLKHFMDVKMLSLVSFCLILLKLKFQLF